MAIYHLSVSHSSRSTGCSSVQSAAYITGEKLYEERRALTANYANRDDVSYAQTLAPEWASDDFRNTEKAWNQFENYEDVYALEKYKTQETQDKYLNSARTAMKMVVALPRELSADAHRELLLDFVNKNYVSKGHVVTLGLHAEEGNPHAHLQISRRPILENGSISYTKNREMCSVLGLKQQREVWANTVNHYLEREGLEQRIDHRSYKDQGLDLIPTTHEGWYARTLKEKGLPARLVEENYQIKLENKQRIAEYPELIFKELNAKKATFSELDVVKVVQNRTFDHADLAQHVFESVMEQAIHIGHGFDRQKRFTSPEYHAKENELIQDIERLSGTTVDRKIAPLSIQSTLNHYRSVGNKISSEQEQAVRTLCADSAFSVLIGRAGTGKTTGVLKPVVGLHLEAGYKVVGMALAAEAAKNLARETGCEADTIAYYTYRWNEIPKLQESLKNQALIDKDRFKEERKLEDYQKSLPTKDTVIIVDEAGMAGTEDWHMLTSMAARTGAKLIVCGDDHQYKAINAGDIFRKAIEVADQHNSQASLTRIFRQNEDWMKEASMNLSQLETTSALMAYENRGHSRELADTKTMINSIADHYLEKVKENPRESGVILTATNEVRLALNKEIRKTLQDHDLLEKDAFIYQGKGFAIGEQILFLTNDRSQYKVRSESRQFAVKNGTRGTLEAVKTVLVESERKSKSGEIYQEKVTTQELTVRVGESERVRFTLQDYTHFDHAYAVTGHKSQGQTVDWSLVHLSKSLDAYGLYVMLTRHRSDITLYHNKEEVESFNKFADNIRVGYKDLAIDYTINPENHEAYFNVEDYKALGREIMQGIKNEAPEGVPPEGIPVAELMKERKELARLIVEEKDDHRLFVMQAGLTFEKLEMAAGLKARPLTLIEQKAQVTVEQYADLCLQARNLWQEIRKTAPGHLAKTHVDYPRFEELRHQRGSLANLIVEAPALHRPFLKEVTKDLGYGLSTLQKQAEAFQSKQLHASMMKEGVSPQTTKNLEVLSSYIDTRDQVSHIWKELKPELQKAEGSLLKATLNTQIQGLKELSTQRDKWAYQIVERLDEFQPLAHSLQVNLVTPKLFEQAENGLRQICIEQYLHSNSQLAKSMAAYELHQLWQAEKEAGIKNTVRELYQNKIDLLGVRASAHQFERIQLASSLTNESDKQLFKDLSHYQGLKETGCDHYQLCIEEAKEKDLKPWETGYYSAYSKLMKEKDAVAYQLIQHPYAKVSSLAEKMHLSLKTLDQEAHRHDLRQQSETYLSGMGAKSIYAAKELQAWLDFDRETGSKQTYRVAREMNYLPRDLMASIQQAENRVLTQSHENRKASLSSNESLRTPSYPQPLSESLKDRLPELTENLLGNPSSRHAFQWRFGKKGSIAVMMNGSNRGLYSNFETGTHGGPLKMIEEQLKLSSKEASTWAKKWLGHTHEQVITLKTVLPEVKETQWTPLLPIPARIGKPDISNNRYLSYMLKGREVKAVFPYRNQEGQPLGYVVRLEDKDGSKITPTLTYCQNEKGQQHWRWKGFEGARPLYGLERLGKDKPVLIVEGEKAADAAQKMLPDYAVVSWPGGAGAVNKADWSPLIGKTITIWPDNDVPGMMAAEKITKNLEQLHQLQEEKAQIKTVELPKDLPAKWDLADKFPEHLSVSKIEKLISSQPLSSLLPVSKQGSLSPAIAPSLNESSSGILLTIKDIIQENRQYDLAKDMVDRVYKTYRDLKEVINDGPVLSSKEELHLLKQCVCATGEALSEREIFSDGSFSLARRLEGEKIAWIKAIKMKKTASLEINLPFQMPQQETSSQEKWNAIVEKTSISMHFDHPNLDLTLNAALAQEKIRLVNLFPHHKDQVKDFMDHKISQVDNHQHSLIEGAAALLSDKGENTGHSAKDTIEVAKTLMIKEMVAQPSKEGGFIASPLAENIRLEMKQEQQRQQFMDQRLHQQQMQHDNQRTL